MANPEAVADAEGEWIEIFNSTASPLLLNGLILKDAGTNKHTVTGATGLVIKAGGFWILVKEKDPAVNGGIQGDYQYANFTLGNSSDQVILTLPDGTVIDQVSYGDGWPIKAGASMELNPEYVNAADNDLVNSWIEATLVYGAGDKGSPGRINTSNFTQPVDDENPEILVYPNPSRGTTHISADFPAITGGSLRIINTLGQIAVEEQFGETLHYSLSIDRSRLAPGLWFIRMETGTKIMNHRFIIE
jgi:hypothetical protein